MNDLLRCLGQRIRELRNQKGWSQEEFADVCGVHRTYMGHLERGEKNLSFSSIVRVANALNITLSELFSGLESGEPATVPSAVANHKVNREQLRSEMDRNRILKELAVLERAVTALKAATLGSVAKAKPASRNSQNSSDKRRAR